MEGKENWGKKGKDGIRAGKGGKDGIRAGKRRDKSEAKSVETD